MLNKRGQLTIIIIIAIVVFIIITLFFIFSKKSFQENTNSFDKSIEDSIINCIELICNEAVYKIGSNGGYYFNIPDPKRELMFIEKPVYFKERRDHLPSLKIIEKELGGYVNDNIKKCISPFESRDLYEIKTANPNTKTNIDNKGIKFSIDYAISIRRENKVTEIKDFDIFLEFDLFNKYNIVKNIIEKQKDSPDMIPIGFLTNFSYSNNYLLDITLIEDDVYLFSLIFAEQNQDGENFTFEFIMDYNGRELKKEKVNGFILTSKKLEVYPMQEIFLNDSTEEFNYQINAIGEDITFYDYSDNFDINPVTGEFFLNKDTLENGKSLNLVKVEDSFDNSEFAYITINTNVTK